MSDDTLFGGYEPPSPPDASKRDELSAGRRLTLRQKTDVANGRHPLTGTPLHPQATRYATADDGPNNPFTCGTCVHRIMQAGGGGGDYPKCGALGARGRTHSAATDVRAWWPACPTYQEKP